MRLPNFIYSRIKRAESIPWWARLLWPTLHYCCEWDGLLIDKSMDEYECCRCHKEAKQ
jgi:hypothetical protein